MTSLKDQNGVEVKSTEGLLQILYDFYKDLYAINELSPSQKEMEDFLKNIISLPHLMHDLSNLIGPITSKEVGNAIKNCILAKLQVVMD